jgi:hypothetical protein
VEQTVHVTAGAGFAEKRDQYTKCFHCKLEFSIRLTGKIVGGPFRA